MSESVTIARPYAQAVFRLACENQTLPAWSDRLQRLAMIADNSDMTEIIGNPKYSAGQIAELIVSLSGEPDNKELASFIGLLAENERLGVLGQVRDIFEALKSAEEGVKDAVIVSAYPLADAQLTTLTAELESHFGSRLRPRVELDATLIGGVRVSVGDQILDISVRGKLDSMASALKN